jgi:hypothetical protein
VKEGRRRMKVKEGKKEKCEGSEVEESEGRKEK